MAGTPEKESENHINRNVKKADAKISGTLDAIRSRLSPGAVRITRTGRTPTS
jgi:hypothetical protein